MRKKMEGVRRWLVDISSWDPSPGEFSSLVSLLPRANVLLFITLDDRKRALVSRLLQYSLVHEVLDIPYNEIIIKRTIEGKPYLNTCRQSNRYLNFNFNVSHSGNFVGIVSEPVFLVGLDIVSDADFKHQAKLNLLNGLSSHFTYLEWKNIISAGNSNLMFAEFCRYWSLKEAYMKALGAGLGGFQLNRVEFHHTSWRNISVHVDGKESSYWKFWLFELDEKHWASIARGGAGKVAASFMSSSIHEDLEAEEYSSMFALPNPQFIFRSVDQLIPATDSGN
ncbi:unnamed protein product [Spirodela intermedia]|uniref:holo-[acyl-carrier-protein] synthase n=1 Tax=Spirodela intermedia TaxID=51605 RepID=A0A7I8IPC6_SPIIN|nr:unnamed protein product [Spirodela intermedia]CAA6659798.1 unnamed protein product [Spirodela intermedia]